jgi:hypothetical protein
VDLVQVKPTNHGNVPACWQIRTWPDLADALALRSRGAVGRGVCEFEPADARNLHRLSKVERFAFRWQHRAATVLPTMLGHVRFLRLGLLGIALFGFGLDSGAQGQPGSRLRATPNVAEDPRYGPGGVYARIPARDEFGRDQLAMFRGWNPDPVGNHQANLRALHPALAKVVRKAQVDNPSLRFVIGSGRRDGELQRQAVAWGWSMTRDSPHLSGNAVDLWPLDGKGRVYFDRTTQNRIAVALKKAAAELGVSLYWGGHFHGFKHMDRSHFELASP